MKKYCLFVIILINWGLCRAQSSSEKVEGVEVTSTTLVKLGHSSAIRSLKKKNNTSREKRLRNKSLKKAPENFKGRRGESKAVHKSLEHQGPDPIRQTDFPQGDDTNMRTLIKSFDGINSDFGSPNDPSGDVSDSFYVMMINATDVGVFDLDGNLIDDFAANTLWSEFSQSSEGDPIVLYDENVDRWILTEFADPANILIAISDNGDPLGAYSAYNFSTPEFPDYPKYGLSPEFLTLTSNEEGGSTLHQYFIDLQAMYNGDEEVTMQRVAITGNGSTETGFYITTPVDYNGAVLPYDNNPMTLVINDSSWNGGPAQDQVEVYTFKVNLEDVDSTEVIRTSIITTPFDGFPCSDIGFGFGCVPQLDGHSLDAVPEVIMHVPHQRNFGTHESMVFSFITDATDGENVSGIRWVELRRLSAEEDWSLYQEGTFAPDDGKDRFLPSIAIDGNGNIGLAYNVSSNEDYVGTRYTGRNVNDPLGIMTVEEVTIVEGLAPIESGERFGDYSQMSVSPFGDNTFWWTSEYAGEEITKTRVVAFKIFRDTFDLTVKSIDTPVTSATLTTEEEVTVSIFNSGIEPMSDYIVELLFQGESVDTIAIADTLLSDSILQVTFSKGLDLSAINRYELGAAVTASRDDNRLNDTLRAAVNQLYDLEAGILAKVEDGGCDVTSGAVISIMNNGANPIDSMEIAVEVNGTLEDTFTYVGSISTGQSAEVEYAVTSLVEGDNTVKFTIISINGGSEDRFTENDVVEVSTLKKPENEFIIFSLTTDDYPGETNWSLFSQGDMSLIASGDFIDERTTVNTRICVSPDSCFTLVVTDDYDDGICCGFGNGNFSVSDYEGNVILTNDGNFGAAAEESFCATAIVCSLILETTSTEASGADVADGIIMVEASGGVEPFTFSLDGGATFQDSAIFTGVLPGNYEVLVSYGDGACEATDSVTVGFTSSVVDVDGNLVDVNISPNPTTDIFKISISNLNITDPQLTVQILDLSGHLIQERKIGNYSGTFISTFSLIDHPAGTYLVKIEHEKFVHLDKVVRLKN